MSPTFTVVVPTYNRVRWLRESIDSLLAQDYGDFECVVVDDAGTEPLDLPDDPRIRLLRHETNTGVAGALNTGLDARGDYVTFLDDDDRYRPDRLSMTVPSLGRAPIVLCWAQVIGRPPPRPGADGGRVLEGNVYDTILDDRAPPKGAAVIERTVIPRFAEKYGALEDLEWWLRTTRAADVTTVQRVGYLIRHHASPRNRNGQVDRINGAECCSTSGATTSRRTAVPRRCGGSRWASSRARSATTISRGGRWSGHCAPTRCRNDSGTSPSRCARRRTGCAE